MSFVWDSEISPSSPSTSPSASTEPHFEPGSGKTGQEIDELEEGNGGVSVVESRFEATGAMLISGEGCAPGGHSHFILSMAVARARKRWVCGCCDEWRARTV